MVDLADLRTELTEESAQSDAPLAPVDWARPTPPTGRAVGYQIAPTPGAGVGA
ncbi:hypothetical protein [Micromonospora sp. DT233]|uniref:hypothetical protein n=1 Tax=Micromonospora sp. DT233 TaxID=3393432 RepID=UPI003CEB43B0